MIRTRLWGAALLFATVAVSSAHAQGTAADYARAAGLRQRFEGLVVDAPGPATWIDSTSQFWYRKSVKGGNVFVVVDATTLKKRPAFDHDKLAAALSSTMHGHYTGITLPFETFRFIRHEHALRFVADTARWTCTLTDYRCTKGESTRRRRGRGVFYRPPPDTTTLRISPDSSLEAYLWNYNIFVRPVGSPRSAGKPLSWDGSEGDPYVLRTLRWSPDSKKIAVYRVEPGYQRMVHYVESSPSDQVQPRSFERFYPKPGDVLDLQRPTLFNLTTHKQVDIDNALFPNPFSLSRLEWRKDSHAFTFEYNQRGHQVYSIIEVNATTGAARAVITEHSDTFIDYRRARDSQYDSGRQYRYDVDDGKEVIWMSERDGWAHLYLYNGITGKLEHQITKGHWLVRAVERVDEKKRQIYFAAGGSVPGQDPYFLQYYRINFDGTGMTPLTTANGNHHVVFSADGQYYVDTWSRVDLPPISQLRRTSDQKVLMDLEHGDDSALLAAGWRPPQVFVAKGRDGKTDIWGVIVKPTDFDSTKKYPVIENIYAGPQGSFVPKDFRPYNPMESLAELGFIVVQIDGMGTANRSKAFHDVIWKNLGDAGFADRILWHKAVAAKYPWYDISRVGIYGTSAGGQNSLGAMLFHPEFYKAAVSAAGCHDNRMDKVWWNEQWMGWPVGPQYAASSNVVHAGNLQGKLLLIVGELDTNVDPSSTMQVVNALIKAGKMFDLLMIPGADHTNGGPYGLKKRDDFFVHNLLGVEPPNRNAVATPASTGPDEEDLGLAPTWDDIWADWVAMSGLGPHGTGD